jgi:hypothetical protein
MRNSIGRADRPRIPPDPDFPCETPIAPRSRTLAVGGFGNLGRNAPKALQPHLPQGLLGSNAGGHAREREAVVVPAGRGPVGGRRTSHPIRARVAGIEFLPAFSVNQNCLIEIRFGIDMSAPHFAYFGRHCAKFVQSWPPPCSALISRSRHSYGFPGCP